MPEQPERVHWIQWTALAIAILSLLFSLWNLAYVRGSNDARDTILGR